MLAVKVASYVLLVASAALIYGRLSGKNIPLIGSDKAAFYTLWVVGLLMSLMGGLRDFPDGNARAALGGLVTPLYILGALAFVLLLVMVTGIRFAPLRGYREAFVALSGVIALKWVLVHGLKLVQLFQPRA